MHLRSKFDDLPFIDKKRWPTFLSIWSQSNKRINIWTHRFVLCNAGIFSFSSFAFGPKFSSKIMASAALNITFSRCVCLHPEYEILFERSFRICSIYTRTSAISACDKLLTSQWIAIPRIFTTVRVNILQRKMGEICSMGNF